MALPNVTLAVKSIKSGIDRTQVGADRFPPFRRRRWHVAVKAEQP